MKIKIQITVESDKGQPEVVQEAAHLDRGILRPETLGLTLAEARLLFDPDDTYGIRALILQKLQDNYANDEIDWLHRIGEERTGRRDFRAEVVGPINRIAKLVRNEAVRAIVTDLHMPGMDGFELMDRVRSHQVHRGVPIIVITGCTDVDAPEQARIRGANAVFMKPYSPARVREKLEQLLSDDTPRG